MHNVNDDSMLGIDQSLFDALQPLMEPCDRKTYSQRLREAATKLNKSIRTIQRLMKRWQEQGVEAFIIQGRSDKGYARTADDWQEFIVKTHEQGNKGGRKMTPAQVYLRVQARAKELGLDKHPSHMTVYRILNPIKKQKEIRKSLRSPGWKGSQMVLPTRDGHQLIPEFSNHVWQCDHTPADILLVDKQGNLLGRPWITTVCDSYSRCLMGFHIGFDAPSSHRVALALRHSILPKSYGEEYGLHCEWGTYGVPIFLYTDGGKDFRSNHLQQIGAQLGFTCYLRDRPSSGGIIERPFGTFNTSFFSSLPGYTGSNVKERPKNTEKEACLTIDELDKYLVRFFVDNYNQSIDTRIGDQTRFQRWEAGLSNPPILPTERELDLCLMKSTQRRVQRGGTIQFENILYRGENLSGYEGKQISLRYDPADITTIFVYCRDGGKETFLTRAHALNLEASSLSFTDNKSAQKQLRESGKNISNDSILAEVENRNKEVAKTVKDRRQKAHSTFHSKNRMTNEQIETTVEVIEEATSSLNSLELLQPVKTWDLDEDY